MLQFRGCVLNIECYRILSHKLDVVFSLQRRASQARAKRIRSILADTDSRQGRREARELKARGAARILVHAER